MKPRKTFNPKFLFVYSVNDPMHKDCVRIGEGTVRTQMMTLLLPNSKELNDAARKTIDVFAAISGINYTLHHTELAVKVIDEQLQNFSAESVRKVLQNTGISLHKYEDSFLPEWFDCTPQTAVSAIDCVKKGLAEIDPASMPQEDRDRLTIELNTDILSQKPKESKPQSSHGAADALDWDEAMETIDQLIEDGQYRKGMLMACGCYMGLRISDILPLKWKALTGENNIVLEEKKTGKKRSLRINQNLKKLAVQCQNELEASDEEYIFCSQQYDCTKPMSRQRAAQIFNEIKRDYHIRSAKTFSAHSLRKTFGRRVWDRECEKGKGETALILLCDVFNHSNVNITKRYLGIRQEEILSVYDTLE